MKRSGNSSGMEDLEAQAVTAGLLYVSDTEPGIRRVRRGKNFEYIGPDEKLLTDQAELDRIASLAIPPAYNDVWICVNEKGHLQATGVDARMRKQYRYHPDWRVIRDSIKFDRMADFGEALRGLRQRLQLDIRRRGLSRPKVLAAIVTLLDTTRVRVGNLSYARDNRSFGLTTLRKRHVAHISKRRAILAFKGKSGVEHRVEINDRRIVKIIKDCMDLRGQNLFQYLDETGKRHSVKSEHVNSYLQEVTGMNFTAKDFRTWGATLRAFELMLGTPLPETMSKRKLQTCIVSAIRKVAEELRNTVAVCRKSYINPLIFIAWQTGALHRYAEREVESLQEVERGVLALLRDNHFDQHEDFKGSDRKGKI